MKDLLSGWHASLGAHWRGEAALSSAFWVVGVLGSFGVYLAALVLISLSWLFMPVALTYVLAAAVATMFAFACFASVAIWRCWRNSGWILWGYLARVHLILFALLV